MGIFILCWLGLDLLIAVIMWRKGEYQRYLCSSCRYLAKGTENKWGTCKILGCPAYCNECKYYEQWGSNK